MAGFQEVTPQQKMIEAINKPSFDGVLEAMRLGANPSEITDENLRSKLLELLEKISSDALGHVFSTGKPEDYTHFVDLVENIGGRELLTKMLTADNYRTFSVETSSGRVENCKNMVALAEKLGGTALVKEMLKADDYKAFIDATESGYAPIVKYLVGLAEELGGKDLVKEMLKAADYAAFNNGIESEDLDGYKYLVSLAYSLGGITLVKEMLQANNYGPFVSDAQFGETENCKYLIQLAEKLGGTALVTEMLRADNYAAIRYDYDSKESETKYYIATNPYLDVGGREVVREELLKTPHITVAGVKTPSPDDFGVIGKPYQYALMRESLYKLEILAKGLGIVDVCNIKQIIANHKNPRGNVSVVYEKDKVNWGILSEVLRPVSHQNCDEIIDTAIEVTQYISAYLLAQQHPDKTQLKSLSKEELNEQLEPIKQQVYRYFLEGKTLPQMQKLSDEWHKYRANKVKSSEDGTTLRDFAQSGSWKQVLPEKTITVTDPELAGYTIENLTSSADLRREYYAFDLYHLIDGYTENCKEGYQVFAVRKDGVPETIMGFEVVDGKLELVKHFGYDYRYPEAEEEAVEEWFVEGLEKGTIKVDLNDIGEIKLDGQGKQISEFEDLVGIRLENLTPERLQSNLNILTGFARGEKREWRENNKFYMFGSENKGATLEQFAKTIESGLQQQQRTHS